MCPPYKPTYITLPTNLLTLPFLQNLLTSPFQPPAWQKVAESRQKVGRKSAEGFARAGGMLWKIRPELAFLLVEIYRQNINFPPPNGCTLPTNLLTLPFLHKHPLHTLLTAAV